MDAIIEYASTPEGMLIVVGVAFIGIVLLLTALIFWIGSLLRRRGVKIDQTPDTDDETADSSPAADEAASQDPLAAFDREAAEQSARAASKAPIALARLRAAGPDITAAAEPKLPEPVWNKTRPFSLLQLRNPPPPSRLMPQKCSRRCLQLLHRLFGNPRQNCSRRRPIRSPALAFSSRFPLNADRAYPWLMLTSAGLAWRRSFLIRNRFPVWMKTQ